ncbi:hypothetical protein Q4512_10435 [Oceanihabitans sp. 2_MG-2023]|uniref:hypothetical protein n=1 Tax=Oceanihabitans sp. 2_MG-2023 TaxID=3062661 RepID=UPI0026E17CFB|nr:hypothetical protein [Oceanihabitans sp. 2_MG-2023]MDO6597330.1 hypothetical protein [Oceanihabitans sp. 2_MG-2023]
MKEFLLDNKSFLIKGFEIMAAVIGILYFKKYKNTAAKYFIYILIYVAVIELIGAYTIYVNKYEFLKSIKVFLKGTVFEKNRWWYTLFWSIGGVKVFSFYYQKILNNKTFIKILKWSTFSFLGISLVFIISDVSRFFTGTFPAISILGSIIIMQCAFFYFFEILQSDKVLMFYKTLNFYISASILIFWLVNTPLIFFSKYYTIQDQEYVHLKTFIMLGAIGFMYTTFAIGLIVSKPEYD